jgi:hypothetical protein
MIEGSPRPVWETLPVERQRSLLLTLGRMAMRQIRGASTIAQMAIEETANDDDKRGSPAASAGGRVREDLSAAP